ncbi:hypothetical protein ALT721_1560063 [Alteromonas alvinellae]
MHLSRNIYPNYCEYWDMYLTFMQFGVLSSYYLRYSLGIVNVR